jgi:HEAT repeat protein
MDLKALKNTPPWDWPEDTPEKLVSVLRDEQTAEPDRVLATEIAGDFTVVNDGLVEALLALLRSCDESERVRGRAAISLGPILEYADTEGFDDAGDVPISERTFRRIEESLRELYMDAQIPWEVRRRILEASVRAPQDWHESAVRSAYASGDDASKLTAVFCMRFVRGFDEQIVAELDSRNPGIHLEAVLAAGNWGIRAAWPHVAALIHSGKTPKPLLLAAIEAVPSIRPQEAREILTGLAESDDEDIVEAVHEALAFCEDEDDDEEEEDDLS